MADLSTLDETAPGATDPVSQGDDAIRATRAAVKTSFGGTDAGSGTQTSEHFLSGQHKFPTGAPGVRPAAGNAGRMFWDTTNKRVERDTGAAWVQLNTVQLGVAAATASQLLIVSYADVPGLSVTIDVPAGGRVLITGDCLITGNAASTATVAVLQNGVALREIAVETTGTSQANVPFSTAIAAPATGSVTYKIQAKIGTGFGATAGGTTLNAGQIQVLVL